MPDTLSLAYDWPEARRLFDRLKAADPIPKSIHASTSVFLALKRCTPPVFLVNRLPDNAWAMTSGLKVIPRPELDDGCYAIEYSDGTFEWHGMEVQPHV